MPITIGKVEPELLKVLETRQDELQEVIDEMRLSAFNGVLNGIPASEAFDNYQKEREHDFEAVQANYNQAIDDIFDSVSIPVSERGSHSIDVINKTVVLWDKEEDF